MLIDSHAHLDDPQFKGDRDQVITHAVNTGIQYILNVATDLESLSLSTQLADLYDFIFLSAGIHPHNAGKEVFNKILPSLNHPKLVAIGEDRIGLL